MTLDEELRAALSRGADMQIAPRPDVQDLISGGRARRRRRTATRIGVSIAAAVVLAGGSAYAVTQLDSSPDAVAPSGSAWPSKYMTDGGAIEPGTYRLAVSETIAADLTFGGSNWVASGHPLVSDGVFYAGVGVYRPALLTGARACSGDWQAQTPGTTSQELAGRLARLPMSTVVEPAAATTAFGHDAVHLQLQINARCPAGQYYLVAESVQGGRQGVTYDAGYGTVPPDVVIDFWVVDVDGTPVVVDLWRQVGASNELLHAARAASESISFVSD